MKRILTILSFISIGSTSVLHAQTSMFDLGLEGGPNLSTFLIKSDLSNLNQEPAIYGSGGFIFQYNCKKILSFKTGLSYQRKGFLLPALTFTDADGNYVGKGETNFRYDYLTLPLLVKAGFGKKVNFFVNAGPYIGYLLAGSQRTKINDQENTQKDNLNDLKRWDFGISGGIGVAIPIRTFWVLSVEVRNYTGLSDITEPNTTKWTTNTTDLRVGIAYKVGFRTEE